MDDPDRQQRLAIFLAFAQDHVDPRRRLRSLLAEEREIRAALEVAENAGLCEVIAESHATPSTIWDVFQKKARNRIAIFHFGGHADSARLLLEAVNGATAPVFSAGFASFLGEYPALKLVFLNGCATEAQAKGLLDTGVDAVIATSGFIEDQPACDFAVRFYTALAHGATLRSAFAQADGALRSELGENPVMAVRNERGADHGRWPWQLHVREGSDALAEGWSLPQAAGDPLFGLPPLPPPDGFPEKPYKRLNWFESKDAEIFFGRGKDIRRLYVALTDPVGAPIVLLFGDSGVGKSSLLQAGLKPRLAATHEVRSERHKRSSGLTETLLTVLGGNTQSALQAWQDRESQGKPLIVILDQLEEAWTRKDDALTAASAAADRSEFIASLRELFHAAATRPQGRLLLSFRKEWLAEVLRVLDAGQLPRTLYELDQLDRAGIIEAITGPSRQPRLQQWCHLRIDDDLPGKIADELLSDRHSAIAPTLQILLAKMWEQASKANIAAPEFLTKNYLDLKNAGLLLKDFVGGQLDILWKNDPRTSDSGLLIDVLHQHTTPFGSADAQSIAKLHTRYGVRPEVAAVVNGCVNAGLLMRMPLAASSASDTQVADECADKHQALDSVTSAQAASGASAMATTELGDTRLAHDTLAPLIRERHENPLRPGQRAARILEQRAVAWQDGKTGATLDEFDLATVEAGAAGMRVWTVDERRLVASSHQAQDRRKRMRRALTAAGVLAVLLIVITSILAVQAAREARQAELRSRDRASAAVASSMNDPAERLLTLLEIGDIEATPAAQDQLSNILAEPVSALVFEKADTARFDRSGSRVLTTWRETGQVWNIDNAEKSLLTVTGKAPESLQNAAGEPQPDFPGVVFNAAGDRFLNVDNDNGTVLLWDVNNGTTALQTFHEQEEIGVFDWFTAVAFSNDGDRVLTATNSGRVFLWDVRNGKAPMREFKGHKQEVVSVMFNARGDRVLTASLDRTAKLWNVDNGKKPLVTFEVKSPVNFAAIDVKGGQILTADKDGYAKLWKVDDGSSPIHRFGRHARAANSAIFNSAGDRVLTTSDDGTAKLWDIDGGFMALQTFSEPDSSVKSAVFNETGDQILTVSGSGIARLYYLSTGKTPLKSFMARPFLPRPTVAINSAGTRVLTLDRGSARLWDINDDVTSLRSFMHTTSNYSMISAAFSPGDDKVLTASADSTVWVWDIDNEKEPVKRFLGGSAVNSAVFTSRGDQVLVASQEGAELWSLDDEHSPAVVFGSGSDVGFAASSTAADRVLTISDAGHMRLWRIHDGRTPMAGLDVEPTPFDLRPVGDLSAIGDRILTTSATGVTYLRVPDDLANAVKTFRGPKVRVTSAIFNRTGNRVLAAYADGTARLWNVDNDQIPLQTFTIPSTLVSNRNAVRTAAFTPDGDHVLIEFEGGQVRLWPASGEALKAVARARTRQCLSAASIEHALGDTKPQAEARHNACKVCVPEYFDVLGKFPAGSIESYRQAWNHYKHCYSQRRRQAPVATAMARP